MGSLEDKAKHNANLARKGRRLRPDPSIQARDNYSRPYEGTQPAGIIPTAERPVSIADAKLLHDGFMGARGPTQSVTSMKDVAESMWRHKWMVLAIFVLVAAPSIVAIWTQVIPQYRARAEVRVRPIIPYLVFQTEDSGMIPLYSSFVNTQVSIVRSFAVLERVLDQQEVRETQWYKGPPERLLQRLLRNPPAAPLERLRDALSVRPRDGTEIIDVSLVDSSARDAKIIVDAVLKEYLRYIGEKSDATKDELYNQLVEEYKSLENEILGRERISAELRKRLRTGLPQELISSKRVQLDGMQVRLSELQQTIAILEWEVNQTGTDDSNDVAVRRYHEDAEWRNLDVNVRTLRHQIDKSMYTPDHPEMRKLTKDLEFAGTLLRRRESQLDEQWRRQTKNAEVPITVTGTDGPSYTEETTPLEYRLARTKQEERLLRAELDKQQAEFAALFESAQLLTEENNALEHKRELFNVVQRRLDQKNMERNVRGSIEVLTWASTPSKHHDDRRIVFTAMLLVTGLFMGGGVAFLRASRDQVIHAPKDMPHPVQVPFLGHIPESRIRRSIGKSLSEEFLRIRARRVESIRLVRTALLSRLEGHGSSTILVTSAAGGTGKSSFTMMLGKSFAQAGKKVLMIDADLRKMTLSKRFGLAGEPGLMESLRSKSVDRRHIFPTETSGLSILSAGRPDGDGSVFEGTANGAFKACIDQLRRHFSIILLDSSPVMAVADATILSNQVDGTIMVERELVSRRPNVVDALDRLDSTGGRLMGTVFVGSGGCEDYGYGWFSS